MTRHFVANGALFGLLGLLPGYAEAQVQVSINNDEVTIGNQYLSRTVSVKDNRLRTVEITNKRTDGQWSILHPTKGSEEFTLSVFSEAVEPKVISRAGWTATVDSWCKDSQKGGEAKYIVDGDVQSFWHSNYRKDAGTGTDKLPHYIQIDMKRVQTFKSFAYVPRQGAENGRFKAYELYVSNSAENIEKPENLVAKGELEMNADAPCWVNLPKTAKGRYIRLKEISSQNGGAFGTCAEFYVSAGTYVSDKRLLKSSVMSINGLDGVRIENMADGKRVIFDMQPLSFAGSNWDVDVVYEMKNTDHFMRKYLRVSVPESQRATARIDYIDVEHLGVASAEGKWTHPAMGEGVGGMSGYHISLGQPIYAEGMFFGSEFPETDNAITDNIAHVRYYSGKSLAELNDEKRLNSDGQFTTWKNVIGSTRSVSDMDVIRSDFFAYINTIAKPIKFRLQYNSWFDWMMDITEENILSSFKEVERGLTQNGVRPVDSYVVDDGWNAYGPYEKDNTTGFWQFNSKFPNGLTYPADFSHRVSSNFGLWLGPRGGYNYQYDFAKFLEKNGNGTVNKANYDIVTGDKQYLKKLEEFFLKCQNDYDINYWKFDGFCAIPPQPSTNGRYITGGKNNMYYMTEHWERWANLLNNLYADADRRNSDLWINLTCYVNPSPWLLQWGKSVWMQISADIGHIKVDEGRSSDLDQILTYRDDRYFDFIKTREFQFPFSNIFNHDPTYGKSYFEPNSLSDDDFRTCLYMMATRGAAFWELLYSYTLMDEGGKWMINAEVLNFLEKNYSILRNAKLIGDTPAKGNCYGFSCWDDKEGIISVRNPRSETQTFTIKLNRTIGVPEGAKSLWRTLVCEHNSTQKDDNNHAFNYDDEIKVTLGGGEVRIWKFSPVQDVTPAKALTIEANTATCDTVVVTFDEPVDVAKAKFAVTQKGKQVCQADSVTLLADLRSVSVKLPKALKAGKAYELSVESLSDWNGNTNSVTVPFGVYKGAEILTAKAAKAGKQQVKKCKNAVADVNDFSVVVKLEPGVGANGNLLKTDGVSVSLKDGHVVFATDQNLTMTSRAAVNDGKAHTIVCVREKNGMLKIYIDSSEVDSSVYRADVVTRLLVPASFTLGDTRLGDGKMGITVLNRALTYKEAGLQ